MRVFGATIQNIIVHFCYDNSIVQVHDAVFLNQLFSNNTQISYETAPFM